MSLESRPLAARRAASFASRARRCFESSAARVFVAYLECESLLLEPRDGLLEEERLCLFDAEYLPLDGDLERLILRGLGERLREDRRYLSCFSGYLLELLFFDFLLYGLGDRDL